MGKKNQVVGNQKGFTLIELVVAISIMLVIGAAVTPMLLSHLKDARVASVNETLLNTKTAFDSYFLKKQGVLPASGIVADMVNEGLISRAPDIQNITGIQIVPVTAGDFTSYVLYGTIGDATALTAAETAFLTTLEEKVDDGAAATGTLRVTDGFAGAEGGEIAAGTNVFQFTVSTIKNA